MNPRTGDLQDALRTVASLISKCDKAQRKLAPGTWQHTMLRNNLQALRVASALFSEHPADADGFTRSDLEDALRAVASMAGKAERAEVSFSPGTSQHTLQRNRLKALRMAQNLIKKELRSRAVV